MPTSSSRIAIPNTVWSFRPLAGIEVMPTCRGTRTRSGTRCFRPLSGIEVMPTASTVFCCSSQMRFRPLAGIEVMPTYDTEYVSLMNYHVSDPWRGLRGDASCLSMQSGLRPNCQATEGRPPSGIETMPTPLQPEPLAVHDLVSDPLRGLRSS